jgi:hypothetical protein
MLTMLLLLSCQDNKAWDEWAIKYKNNFMQEVIN